MGCALWCRPLTIQVAVNKYSAIGARHFPEKPGTILGRRSKIESKTEDTEQHLESKATNRIEVKSRWHRCDTEVPPLHPHRKHNSWISTFELFVFWTTHEIYASDSHQLHKKWDSRLHKKHAKQHNEQTRIAQSFKRKETNRLITRNLTHWRQTTQNNKMKHHLIMSSSWLLLKALGYWFLEF